MNKLLVICGPTATGKTNLAIKLGKILNGEIVSADSRQVYRGMNIGTGKDLPLNSSIQFPIPSLKKLKVGRYVIGGVNVWGYDLVDPDKEFSISQYIKISQQILDVVWAQRKLPILVGGTGFFIKGIVDGIETVDIPQNQSLRNFYAKKSPNELFEILSGIDTIKSASLNASDKKNPRRLIRAIEIATFKKDKSLLVNKQKTKNVLFIGLKAPKEELAKKIKVRIQKRISDGMEQEVLKILSSGVIWDNQSMNTLGYKEWRSYFDEKIGKEELLERWLYDEIHYAKRQMTWFKKDARINWYDISLSGWEKSVEKLVEKWHNGVDAKKD